MRFNKDDVAEFKKQFCNVQIFYGTVGPSQAIYVPMHYILAENVGQGTVQGVSRRFFVHGDIFGVEAYHGAIQAAGPNALTTTVMREFHKVLEEQYKKKAVSEK